MFARDGARSYSPGEWPVGAGPPAAGRGPTPEGAVLRPGDQGARAPGNTKRIGPPEGEPIH